MIFIYIIVIIGMALGGLSMVANGEIIPAVAFFLATAFAIGCLMDHLKIKDLEKAIYLQRTRTNEAMTKAKIEREKPDASIWFDGEYQRLTVEGNAIKILFFKTKKEELVPLVDVVELSAKDCTKEDGSIKIATKDKTYSVAFWDSSLNEAAKKFVEDVQKIR